MRTRQPTTITARDDDVMNQQLHREDPLGTMLREGTDTSDRADRLGLYGLLVFSLCAAPFTNVAGAGLLVLLVAFIISKRRMTTWHEPIMLIILGMLLYLPISILIGWQLHPHRLHEHLSHAFYILSLPLLTLLVAWALKGNAARIHLVLLAALCGYIFAITLPLLLGEVSWSAFLSGERNRMMFGHPIRLGLYSATVLLALLLWTPVMRTFELRRLVLMSCYVLLLLMTVQALIVSQARVSWIASAVVIPMILLARLWLFQRVPKLDVRSNMVLLALGLLLTATVVYFNHGTIEHRWSSESATIQAAVQGGDVEFNSFGIRVHMWNLGLEKIIERPWLGHGPGSVPEYLSLAQSPLSDYSHMHSTPIDILVRTGIIGMALVVIFFTLLFYALFHNWRTEGKDRLLLLFSMGALLLFLIDSLTGYPISRTQGRFFIAIIGGIAYSGYLYRQHVSVNNTSQK